MDKKKVLDIIEKIAISPIFISFFVFIVATFVVVRLTINEVKSAYNEEFIRDVLVEAHGMLFDILIIGIFIFALQRLVENRREKKLDIRRWQEEIFDYRRWFDPEAMHRIVGNIRRLNRNGINRINLSWCFLEHANLVDANLKEADLSCATLEGAHLFKTNFRRANLFSADISRAVLFKTDLQGANLWAANLENASLREASLQGANLKEVNLQGTRLIGVNFHEVENLTIEQLSEVETLYHAKLDQELLEQVKEKYPHLLEKPEDEEDWA